MGNVGYLTLTPKNFLPPSPFSLSEFEDRMPERTYTKEELSNYLQFCRKKCHDLTAGLTTEIANSYWINESETMRYNVSNSRFKELTLCNLIIVTII